MSAGSFEKTNWGWQLRQLQQRIGEWWEWQTNRAVDRIPDISWPDWLESELLWTVLKIALWLGIALTFCWLAVQGMRLVIPYLYLLQKRRTVFGDNPPKSLARELAISEWLKQSEKYQKEGNYAGACRCIYMAMLQGLNDREIIRNDLSRTDGEYLQIIQKMQQSPPYETLFNIHQQICFSNLEASLTWLEQCQQAYREIERS